MTLAIHGKSHRRHGILSLAAFIAVLGAILAGATLRPVGSASAAEDPTVRLCSSYVRGGPLDDVDRVFTYSYLIESDEPQGGATWQGDIQIILSEGESYCVTPIPVPASGTITITQLLDPAFDSFQLYPLARHREGGPNLPWQLATTQAVVQLSPDCSAFYACEVEFRNRHAYDPQADYGVNTYTICKEYQASGPIDDFGRIFEFDLTTTEPIPGGADLIDTTFSITVDEGATECQEFTFSNWVYFGIAEAELPGWFQGHFLTWNGGSGITYANSYVNLESQGECVEIDCKITFVNRQEIAPPATDPLEGDNSIVVCKYYEQGGPPDDFGRTFKFSLYIDQPPLGNADSIHDFSITVDEGGSNCTDAMQIPANATIGVQEIGSAGFTNAPGYPKYELIQFGQQADSGQDVLFFFNNENDCQPETPCIANFFNRGEGEAEYPIRICKTLIDNGDGYQRPDTTFTFDANYSQTTVTVAEGETECSIVYVALGNAGDTITVSEHLVAGFENAAGFPKNKVDSYPSQSTPDMGDHAGAIIIKIDDGCYEPYLPIEGGPLSLVRAAMSVVLEESTEPFMCTVYFFNQEVPNDGPECEVDCTEPECEIECTEPECETDCGEPQCEVSCDPPICLFPDCEQPCMENCGQPQCTTGCSDTTPTPTPGSPETPATPSEPQQTPEPEEDVEGESTPGPQATPKAPDTGSTVAGPSRSTAPTMLFVSIILLITSTTAGVTALAFRRN